MTGFLACPNNDSLCQKDIKIPIGAYCQTLGRSSSPMETFTEETSLYLQPLQLAFLLLWTGHTQDGILTIGNTVKHFTLVGMRTNRAETGLTNFYAHECKNSGPLQSTQWQ